jgi:hypothetical protein
MLAASQRVTGNCPEAEPFAASDPNGPPHPVPHV